MKVKEFLSANINRQRIYVFFIVLYSYNSKYCIDILGDIVYLLGDWGRADKIKHYLKCCQKEIKIDSFSKNYYIEAFSCKLFSENSKRKSKFFKFS